MAERRRYTKHQKVAAVTAALASSTLAAAEAQGIPESTLRYWLEKPEFAALREKARETIAEESKVAAQLFLAEIVAKRDQFEPRDLAVTFGILVDKSQLLSGAATERLEHREILSDFDDHEREAMTEWLHQLARERLADVPAE